MSSFTSSEFAIGCSLSKYFFTHIGDPFYPSTTSLLLAWLCSAGGNILGRPLLLLTLSRMAWD